MTTANATATATKDPHAGMRYSPLNGKWVKDVKPLDKVTASTTTNTDKTAAIASNVNKKPYMTNSEAVGTLFIVVVVMVLTVVMTVKSDASKAESAARLAEYNQVQQQKASNLRESGYGFKEGVSNIEACNITYGQLEKYRDMNKYYEYQKEINFLKKIFDANCK